jgi:hypothetical protein
MSQTDFIVQNDSSHPLVNKYDHRFMCAQAFEGSSSYVIRKNGSYYEAIKKYGSTGGGMIKYGGVSNLGGVTGTDFDAVLEAAATAIGYNGRIFLKAGVYATNGLNFKNAAAVTDATQQMLEIAGEGMGNTILKGNTTSTGASSTDGAFTDKAWVMADSFDTSGIRIHLHDFQIDGQHNANTNIVSGVVLKNPRNALLQRLFVQRCSKNGINLVGPNVAYRETVVRDNIIYDINDPDGTPDAGRLDHCCGINTTVGFADAYIINNVIGWIGYVDDPTPWLGTCIGLNDSNVASGNIMWTCSVGIETYEDSKDHMITNNWIDYAYDAGVLLTTNIQSMCHDNIIRNPYEYGIYLSNTSKSSIHNNKFIMRPTFTCAHSLIIEYGTANENSIIGNNCFHDGTVTGPTIFPIGANTIVKDNPGFNPKTTVSNYFDSTNHTIVIEGGDAAVPHASQDYVVHHSDVFVCCTDSGNSNCAINIKTPGGATMTPVSLSTLSNVFVPRLHKINWGAFTGAAPTVILTFV